MSDLRTAAQQALNSLRGYRREIGCEQPCDAERSLEAALERTEHGVTLKPVFYAPRRLSNEEVMAVIGPFRETEQEPVACPHRDEPRGCYRVRCQLGRKCVEPLFTHPPRREWRGLTEEEMVAIAHRKCWEYRHSSDPHHSHTYKFNHSTLTDFRYAIEAALKERNV